ncbi:MAG TPA: hypothetical protein VIO60_06355 [Rectinemataceae bacterium]
MGVKKGYAAASLACFIKPFLIGAAALELGLGSSGSQTQGFLRFLIFPHIVPAVCFAFLSWEEEKYSPFRPLAALVIGGSDIALLASIPPLLATVDRTALEAGSYGALARGGLSALVLILIDVFCLLLLFMPWRKKQASKET